MEKNHFDLGMVGLGVMGSNLALNMADHGYQVIGLDKDPTKAANFQAKDERGRIAGTTDPKEFIAGLKKPRVVMMLVPAGQPVDAVIEEISPVLEVGDVLIDGGNSYYVDTDLRQRDMAEKGIQYLGVGISGGEQGARFGPSMMPGGPEAGYRKVQPIFEAVAAKVNGDPCVAYLGPGSAGHYVKMVHNGIEYGLMQLIAETYDLMKRGLAMNDQEIQKVYSDWNSGELNSYLIGITADIFAYIDPTTGKPLVDLIADEAKQKGTGKWTSQDAMDLQVPVPTIDMAVSMRDMSGYKTEREQASRELKGSTSHVQVDDEHFLPRLKDALFTAMILTYTQGMSLLRSASNDYHYHLDLSTVARIWRGGCIIRAAILEPIREAFQNNSNLVNLILDPVIEEKVKERIDELRTVTLTGIQTGIPVPALSASLAYYDAYRSSWLPANLIQAQRDYFGAHQYERIDQTGVFHTQWINE